jgi:hypothetical protein
MQALRGHAQGTGRLAGSVQSTCAQCPQGTTQGTGLLLIGSSETLVDKEYRMSWSSLGRRPRVATIGLATAGLVLSGLTVIPAAAAADFAAGNFVSPELEGCRGSTTSYSLLDPGQPASINNPYICSDPEYTNGNLGKGWNELDLVPHRLTTKLGTQTGATTTYDLIIAGDNSQKSYEGYDRITVPTVNSARSHASCKVNSISATAEQAGVTGGVEDAVYRIVNISQNKGTTCVFDYDMRLSNTSALYSGSSLQGYMFELGDFKTGKRTVPIPVKEVLPQRITKTATAVQGASYGWTVSKEVKPASVTIPDTCSVTTASDEVKVIVTWTRTGPAPAGKIAYHAEISAINPAKRDLIIDVVDDVYANNAAGTLLASVSLDDKVAKANSTTLLGTVDLLVDGTKGYTAIYDKATGTYFDPVLNETISPTKTAEFTASIGAGTSANASATVTDAETIGAGFEFSVDGGEWVTSYNWSENVTAGGSKTFVKKVRTTTGNVGSTTLSDTATIKGVDDTAASEAKGASTILADKKATVTVSKKTLDVFSGSESATFTFGVWAEGTDPKVDPALQTKDVVVNDSTATDPGDSTYKLSTVSFTGLSSGKYIVAEVPAAGWAPQPSTTVDLTGTICSASKTFTNDPQPALVDVTKFSSPKGFEAGWTFDLYRTSPAPEAKLATATTTATGVVDFNGIQLGEGSYKVVETTQSGWKANKTECTFSVDLITDAGKKFHCTFTNTYEPTITVTKSGDALAKYGDDPIDDISYGFKVENTSPTAGAAGAPKLTCTIDDTPITWTTTLDAIGPGEYKKATTSYAVPKGTAAGEFKNSATVTCKYADGSAAPVNGEAKSATSNTVVTDIFIPSISVKKVADVKEVLVGGTINYTVTITNTSSAKTPTLVFKSFTDAKASSPDTSGCATLAVGASCEVKYSYVVKSTDGTSVANTADASFTLDQSGEKFPNVISGSDSTTVDVVRPGFTVSKACTSPLVAPGGKATFKVTFKNTGDVDLTIKVTGDTADAAQITDFTLAKGATVDKTVEVTAPALGGAGTIGNKVTATGSYKTLWSDGKSAEVSCPIGSKVQVEKTTVNAPSSGPYEWQFKLYSDVSKSVAVGTEIGTGSTSGSGNGTISFSALLDPSKTYAVCETNGTPSAAWTAAWLTFNGTAIAVADVWNPDFYQNPSQNVGRSCVTFSAGTSYGLTANQMSTFKVENKYQFTGGQRTIGYWRNWSSCTGGNQAAVAARLGGSAAGRWMIDDVLPMTLWKLSDTSFYTITSCSDAVSLLSKSPIGGKKPSANDALYGMTAQLIAAKANYAAGAGQDDDVTKAIADAGVLLAKYGFNGTASYLPSKVTGEKLTDRGLALQLATLLDKYNNGLPV